MGITMTTKMVGLNTRYGFGLIVGVKDYVEIGSTIHLPYHHFFINQSYINIGLQGD